jgi:DNA-binding winged helix-turn-helix (wHTH) protein
MIPQCLDSPRGDGIDGARYIVNVPGRGYCLFAPVEQRRNEGERRVRVY